MSNRTWHWYLGLITGIPVIAILLMKSDIYLGVIVLLTFIGSVFGAESPDFDQIADKIFNHRDWSTHSAILPTIVFFIFWWYGLLGVFAPLLMAYFVGISSHFLLDLFPVWKGSGDPRKGKMRGGVLAPANWIITGLTGNELYGKLAGTYCIQLPIHIPEKSGKKSIKMRRSLTANQTRVWLVSNALLCITYALFTMDTLVKIF